MTMWPIRNGYISSLVSGSVSSALRAEILNASAERIDERCLGSDALTIMVQPIESVLLRFC